MAHAQLIKKCNGDQFGAFACPGARVEPRALLERFEHADQTALAKSGSLPYTYRIAGCVVRLIFAGLALAPLLTPALAHLACPADTNLPDDRCPLSAQFGPRSGRDTTGG